MTDNETPAAEEGVEDAVEAEPAEETPNNEAAKYRRKLREAEKQRDTLAAHVEALQRAQVDNLLAATGVKSDAVFAVAELADLLAEDGTVASEKLTAAVEAAKDKFGITPPKGTHVPGVGNQPAAAPTVDRWKAAFTPARRR